MTPARYRRVAEEVARVRARVLVEVGTWNGGRAVEMMEAALLAAGPPVVYHGFDLFEDITAEKSAAEMNVKAAFSHAAVTAKLLAWTRARRGVVFKLHRGDTRRTLPELVRWAGRPIADLAWIDGGHSVETVESDWGNCAKLVRPGGVVLMDDYYGGMPAGATGRFGCNGTVARLRAEGRAVTLFPEADPVKGGGTVQIARVQL